jgi:Ca2+-binding EF-hand superfamily protein
MKATGKKLDFSDAELQKMRLYFNELDDKKEGYIGARQLMEPMLSLGIVNSRQELDQIISSVDEDGLIHFE